MDMVTADLMNMYVYVVACLVCGKSKLRHYEALYNLVNR
jgi:hypothetical protein